MLPKAPAWIAEITAGLRNAAANPARCKAKSVLSTLPETSAARTSSRSTLIGSAWA